ncbi:MAG: molecular chaperone HtpG [Candidatus Theseobacter exili]|nr:molecular chaperone HtpG [Candidatus Theseobacter exili]
MEKFEFKAETKQLLDLMIHSIYSNKDIFIRELVSNSSDALDKLRFESLTNKDLHALVDDLHIRIDIEKSSRTFSVLDNGIGMSREEVIEYIGTIAKSGTKEFLKILQKNKDKEISPELIGQFGVGIYSCFMVADKITLITRRAGEESATKWESTGDGSYTIEEVKKDTVGTDVTLHLKEADSDDELKDYTAEWTVKEIVKKYSDYVSYPIRMQVEKKEIERDEKGKPKEGSEEKTVLEDETLNSMKAIWIRPSSEVSDEEYNEFYKHISHDWTDPLERIFFKAEGAYEFRGLMYIPSRAPFDLFDRDSNQGIHLYIKRIFIMNDCKELIPEYLRFIRGVVDSEDLSLNISREILQQNRQIKMIRNKVVSKVLETLKEMKNKENETYLSFWKEFGRVLKEGLFQDRENREKIMDLVLFDSTNFPDKLTSISEYIDRMKDGQDEIYYMTGRSRESIENSPHLEAFKEKGYEVLLLTEPVDEVWVQSVFEYKEKPFKSIGKGAIDIGTEEDKKKAKKEQKEKEKQYHSLLDVLKNKLNEYVKDVRLSNRLKTSPVCLVGETSDMTPQLVELMRSAGQEVPNVKRILEVNPDHEILVRLQKRFEENKDDPIIAEYAQLLYGQALLAEGSQPPDPGKFSLNIADLMARSLN